MTRWSDSSECSCRAQLPELQNTQKNPDFFSKFGIPAYPAFWFFEWGWPPNSSKLSASVGKIANASEDLAGDGSGRKRVRGRFGGGLGRRWAIAHLFCLEGCVPLKLCSAAWYYHSLSRASLPPPLLFHPPFSSTPPSRPPLFEQWQRRYGSRTI